MGKHRSRPYNPLIANTFFRAGFIEAWGRGIEKIKDSCKEAGNPLPEYTIKREEIMVMFKNLVSNTDQATNQANQDLERLDQVEDENVLSEKEIEILNLVRMQPSITQKEMANALDWNLASVKYYITKLKEKNYLKKQGSSQKGKWVILTKRD